MYYPAAPTVRDMVSVSGPHAAFPFYWVAKASSSATYESANRAVYLPVVIPATCVVRRVWWVNGSTVSASYNIDCGVYADGGHKPGRLLVSAGSTAQGTATQVQFADVADTTLAPGLYWVGIVASSTSATLFRYLATSGMGETVRFQEASALPLPATATPAESSSTNLYLCGFATTASP